MSAGEVLAVVSDQPIDRQIDFTDQHAVVKLIDHAPHLRDYVQYLWSIRGIERQQRLVRRPARAKIWIGRIVAEFRILDQMPECIDAEAIDTLLKPETHRIVDRLTYCRVAPVQIRLLSQEGVIIILPCAGVVFPRAAAEIRDIQLFGAVPSARGSRQRYQSRFGLSRELRLSMNHGCWSDVWFGTRSRITFRLLAWAAATSVSKSSSVPNIGSTSR